MDKEVLITIDHVSRYYGEYLAVNDISFQIHRGEVLGFLGPNGAGKSTTMQMISGVLASNAGTISIAGHSLFDEPESAKQHIGFLPENPPLYSDLTVDEYLSYTGRLRKLSGSELPEALQNCKRRCGLEDAGNRLIRNLSKGYQQRVGIAQAIIHSPSVVILDEPTSGLDPIQILEIRDLIRELGEDHSVILSTHILPEVQTVCDRVIIIHQGQLVLNKAIDELQSDTIRSLLVAFHHPPELERLLKIEHIEQVEAIDEHRFRIWKSDEHDIAGSLIQFSVAEGWGLYELIPERQTLEETFVQLTQTDQEHTS